MNVSTSFYDKYQDFIYKNFVASESSKKYIIYTKSCDSSKLALSPPCLILITTVILTYISAAFLILSSSPDPYGAPKLQKEGKLKTDEEIIDEQTIQEASQSETDEYFFVSKVIGFLFLSLIFYFKLIVISTLCAHGCDYSYSFVYYLALSYLLYFIM